MSNFTDFLLLGCKPKLITRYTSGTGTYVPTEDMARCFVWVQGGGGGGGSSTDTIGGGGGGGGAMVQAFIRVPIAGYAYIVGSGGAGSTNTTASHGSFSRFHSITANPGLGGGGRTITPQAIYSTGGSLGNLGGGVNTNGANIYMVGGSSGVAGGSGGSSYSAKGSATGFPVGTDSTMGTSNALNGSTTSSGYGGGGGDSFFGLGGNGASGYGVAAGAATGYGSGGGGASSYGQGSAGMGGLIEIWDFGA